MARPRNYSSAMDWGPLRRIRSAHANHKRIAIGALTIGVLTLLAKIFVAGREMAIAWRYGVSGTVDAYQLALTIVTWVPMLFTGIMAVVLVPRLVSLDRRRDDRHVFLREVNGTVFVVGAAVAIVTFLAAPLAARLMASHLDPKTIQLTTSMVRSLSPVALFMVISGYFMARLQAKERFGYTATKTVQPSQLLFSCWGHSCCTTRRRSFSERSWDILHRCCCLPASWLQAIRPSDK